MVGICFLYSIKLCNIFFWLLNISSLTCSLYTVSDFSKCSIGKMSCVSRAFVIFQPCHTSLEELMKIPSGFSVSPHSPSLSHIHYSSFLPGTSSGPQDSKCPQRKKIKANHPYSFVQKLIYVIFAASTDSRRILKYDFLNLSTLL